MTQIQFHLPDSTSFLRLHKLESYGDSLKDFRFTVNKANEDKEIVRGLEEGVAGYGFRVVYPVSYEGNHVGTVEYGSDFGRGFLEDLKENYSGEFYTYGFEGDTSTLINGTSEDDWVVENSSLINDLKKGQTIQTISEDGKDNVLLMPFKDYNEEVRGYFKVVQDRSELVRDINNIKRNSILYTVILLIVLLGVFYGFLDYSLKPIDSLVVAAERVAAGDLKQTIETRSSDEIGTLAESFNMMILGLREVLGGSDEISGRVASTSEELSAAAEEVTAASEEVANAMTHVSELANNQFESAKTSSITMNDMLEKMEQVSGNIGNINSASQNTLSSAEEGILSSQDAVSTMNNLRDCSRETLDEIRRLNNSSNEIEDIVEVIRDISSQTNLLALNAEIEAARAGEAGAGFAVVAGEVKQLADQSSESTEEISNIVTQIQDQIKTAINSMDSNNLNVESGVNIVNEAGKKFTEILEEINNVAREIEVVAKLIEETKGDAAGVRDNFTEMENMCRQTAEDAENVSASSEEQSAAMEQITTASIELSNMASELLESISVFEY